MEHSFNIEIATKYGIEEAILLNNLYFWICKNIVNKQNFYDNYYWTYNTMEAFAQLFPYMNKRQIGYRLQHLVDENLIIKGNYNNSQLDRTLWYTLTKQAYCILQNCNYEKTKLQNVIYIYINNIINNTNINYTDNKHIPSPFYENGVGEKNNITELFDYWNSKDIIKHNKLTNNIRLQIEAKLKVYSLLEIKTYIDRYSQVISDKNYQFKYKWKLIDFLKQSNAMEDFFEDGSKWVNYCEFKKYKGQDNINTDDLKALETNIGD